MTRCCSIGMVLVVAASCQSDPDSEEEGTTPTAGGLVDSASIDAAATDASKDVHGGDTAPPVMDAWVACAAPTDGQCPPDTQQITGYTWDPEGCRTPDEIVSCLFGSGTQGAQWCFVHTDTNTTYIVYEVGCMPPGWEECSSEAYDATMDRERRGSAQGCPE